MANKQNLLDIEFALSQLSGNSDLLSRMLIKFSDEFSAVPEKVELAIERNDIKEAKLQVHTTKGLSGNLGLMALYECSKELDQLIRDGEVNESHLQKFSSIMVDTCEHIKTIDLVENTPPTFSNTDFALNNTEKNKFLDRLHHNEFIDDDTLFTYINALPFSQEQKLTLKGLVEELQYAKAIDMINLHS